MEYPIRYPLFGLDKEACELTLRVKNKLSKPEGVDIFCGENAKGLKNLKSYIAALFIGFSENVPNIKKLLQKFEREWKPRWFFGLKQNLKSYQKLLENYVAAKNFGDLEKALIGLLEKEIGKTLIDGE